MPTQAPGDLIASRVAVMADGSVAEVVRTERPAPYATTLREAYARWYSGGAWSPWHLVADSAFDVSIAPDLGPAGARGAHQRLGLGACACGRHRRATRVAPVDVLPADRFRRVQRQPVAPPAP